MTAAKTKTKTKTKRRGRPSKKATPRGASAPELSSKVILQRALRLAKTIPLEEVSIVRLSKEFDVTPAAIHYYVSTRSVLISGVMNGFYRELHKSLPPRAADSGSKDSGNKDSGNKGWRNKDWRDDAQACAEALCRMLRAYKGVTHYLISNNQLRLGQLPSSAERDYGLMVFDRVVGAFKDAGFGAENAALAWHLLAQTALSVSHSEAVGNIPKQTQKAVLRRIGPERIREFPGVAFAFEKLTELDAELNRKASFEMMLNYLELLAKKKPHRVA